MTLASSARPTVRRLARVDAADVEALAALMIDVVEGGASIGFMLPLDVARAAAFWRQVGEGVRSGERVLFVADAGDGIVGTVQLIVGQPENQPHRADLAKMMVANRARRQGVGAALMQAAEAEARALARAGSAAARSPAMRCCRTAGPATRRTSIASWRAPSAPRGPARTG